MQTPCSCIHDECYSWPGGWACKLDGPCAREVVIHERAYAYKE